MAEYGLARGAHVTGDAQVIGEALDKVRHDYGHLTPEVVVEAARAKRHPLHDQFEWDDSIAAEEFRRAQAQRLISAVVVITPETAANPPRAYYSVRKVDEKGRVDREYEPLSVVLSNDAIRAQVIDDIRRSIASFQRKLTHLSNVERLISALERADKVAAKIR